jgi:hypothetical protein
MVIKKKDFFEDSDDEEVRCPHQCRLTPLATCEATSGGAHVLH